MKDKKVSSINRCIYFTLMEGGNTSSNFSIDEISEIQSQMSGQSSLEESSKVTSINKKKRVEEKTGKELDEEIKRLAEEKKDAKKELDELEKEFQEAKKAFNKKNQELDANIEDRKKRIGYKENR